MTCHASAHNANFPSARPQSMSIAGRYTHQHQQSLFPMLNTLVRWAKAELAAMDQEANSTTNTHHTPSHTVVSAPKKDGKLISFFTRKEVASTHNEEAEANATAENDASLDKRFQRELTPLEMLAKETGLEQDIVLRILHSLPPTERTKMPLNKAAEMVKNIHENEQAVNQRNMEKMQPAQARTQTIGEMWAKAVAHSQEPSFVKLVEAQREARLLNTLETFHTPDRGQGFGLAA